MLAVRERPSRDESDRHRVVSTEGTETPVEEQVELAGPAADAPDDDEILLRVRGLKKYFPVKQGFLKRTTGQLQAVDGVDLDVRRGETVGLVGESGCGKSSSPPPARSSSTASTSSRSRRSA